ncbi:hypothetical protein [Rhizobium leguminosarum]|uniref:hypothetical protein n=1 Tax=Rhizobium leguminosarum TaxID=384 RepID=UPI001AEA499D|nr:hypothetical protein [Rhizobium leguminosarum]MBP2450082.1 hypothetical protein [Rhizobium leguminosarum]
MKRLLYAAAGLAVIAIAPTGPKAQDAEWGCQILLCAASQNPSWHGVPYCVPPMKKLIAAMSKPGFDWPICHQAKAGEPGREEFEECPAGSHPASSSNGDDHGLRRDEQDQCVRIVDRCENRNEFNRLYGNDEANEQGRITVEVIRNGRDDSLLRRDDGCSVKITSPRARRANPWFFDIPNDKGVKERFWFNLRT